MDCTAGIGSPPSASSGESTAQISVTVLAGCSVGDLAWCPPPAPANCGTAPDNRPAAPHQPPGAVMNPTRITGRLACILAAQAGTLLASIITAPGALATHDPGHRAGTSP
jgi:hypothetical protein